MTAPMPKSERRPNLPGAVRSLRAAVGRLIEPSSSYVNNTYIEIPGLYVQLIDNLAGLQGSGNHGIARSMPAFWCDAAEQKNNIDLMVAVWSKRAGNTIGLLRTLATTNWTPEDTKKVRRLAGIINAWADDITTLLEHEHIKCIYSRDDDTTYAACPACGAETVQKRDSAGELVRSPALQVITEHGATCQNCEHHWAPGEYIDLCRDLGFPLPAGVLE